MKRIERKELKDNNNNKSQNCKVKKLQKFVLDKIKYEYK